MMKLSKKITAILMIGLFSAFLAGCSQDGQSADAAKPDKLRRPMHLHRPVKKERSKIRISSAYGSTRSIPISTKRLPFMPTIHGPKISITWITSIPGPGRLRGTTAST